MKKTTAIGIRSFIAKSAFVVGTITLILGFSVDARATCISGGGLAGMCFADIAGPQDRDQWYWTSVDKFTSATNTTELQNLLAAEHSLLISVSSLRSP